MGSSRSHVLCGAVVHGAIFLLGVLLTVAILIATTLITAAGSWAHCPHILFAVFGFLAIWFLLADISAYFYILLLARGRLSEAEQFVQKFAFVLDRVPALKVRPLLLLAHCYSDEQKYQDADRILTSIDVRYRNLYPVALARMCMGQGKDDEAESVIQKAVERRNRNKITAFLAEWFMPVEYDELYESYLKKMNRKPPDYIPFKRPIKVLLRIVFLILAISWVSFMLGMFSEIAIVFPCADAAARLGKNEQAASIYRFGFDSINMLFQPGYAIVKPVLSEKQDPPYILVADGYAEVAAGYRKTNPVLSGLLYEQAMKFLDDHKSEFKSTEVSAYLPVGYARCYGQRNFA